MTTPHILDFYAHPAVMTSAGVHAPLLDGLPRDVAALARIVQGLVLHEHAAPAYGVVLSDERRRESHLRPVEQILGRLLVHDARPLSETRPVDARIVGICRHIAVLLAAMLRAKGVPARARCGFGSYFARDRFVDHWVCEVWNAEEARWVLVDAQMDEVQRAELGIDFEPLDVPRDRFLTAGEAWARCRAGGADPSAFGIFDLHGLWFVAGNVVRDLAALNKVEMLPWDGWGAMSHPRERLRDSRLAYFDRLAEITLRPDGAFAELRALYEGDSTLQVPAEIFNARLNRLEAV